MASDALFQALAQAKAQPDRWARAVNEGANAGKNIIGGYMQGKELKQQLDQYRLLSTPLGSMYSDPTQIPFGLGPQHTVKDLLTIAPAMENFAPANLMSGVAQQYGANVAPPAGSDGSATARVPTQAPAPTIASTSMEPIPGSETPAPPPGTTALNATEGTGAGGGVNIPPGTPVTTFGGGSSPAPAQPSLNIPPGGMGMGAFQKVVIPALNAAREGRQFQEGQTNENTRSALSREQSARQFAIAQANEKGRAIAGAEEKVAPAASATAQLDALETGIRTLNADPANKSIPFTGNLGSRYANLVPSTTNKWALNQASADSIANVGAGAIEKLVEGRYNEQQKEAIKQALFPTGNELGTPRAEQKLAQLHAYIAQAKAGNVGQVKAALDAIIGGNATNPQTMVTPVASVLPPNATTPPPKTTGDPAADAAISRVTNSSLDPNTKQARINGILAKSRQRRGFGG